MGAGTVLDPQEPHARVVSESRVLEWLGSPTIWAVALGARRDHWIQVLVGGDPYVGHSGTWKWAKASASWVP